VAIELSVHGALTCRFALYVLRAPPIVRATATEASNSCSVVGNAGPSPPTDKKERSSMYIVLVLGLADGSANEPLIAPFPALVAVAVAAAPVLLGLV
jgi:hypothetical protein